MSSCRLPLLRSSGQLRSLGGFSLRLSRRLLSGEFVERYRRERQIAQMVAIDASKRMVEATSEGAVEKAITAILGDASLLELFARAGEPEAGTRAEAGQVPDRKPQPRPGGVAA